MGAQKVLFVPDEQLKAPVCNVSGKDCVFNEQISSVFEEQLRFLADKNKVIEERQIWKQKQKKNRK